MSTQEPTVVDQVDALIRDIPNGWRLDHRALAESLDAAGLLRAGSNDEAIGVVLGWADASGRMRSDGEAVFNTDLPKYRTVGPWRDAR